MNSANRALYCCLIIVWISVFIKYQSLGLFSRSNFQDTDDETEPNRENKRRIRFRQTLKKGYEKISNRRENEQNNLDYVETQETDTFRFRKKFRDVKQRVSGKFRVVTDHPPSTHKPMYRFDKPIPYKNYNYNGEDDYKVGNKPNEVLVPYKPGDSSNSIMRDLAKKIINSGNYNPNGLNKHIYEIGKYNDYNYRPGDNVNLNGSKICSNYLEYGGVVFGKHICPIEGYSQESTECCGSINEQYCCELVEPSNEKLEKSRPKNPYLMYYYLLIFMPALLFIVIMGLVVCIARSKYKLVDCDDS